MASALLLEDGTYLLLEDGNSRLLLEFSTAGGAVLVAVYYLMLLRSGYQF